MSLFSRIAESLGSDETRRKIRSKSVIDQTTKEARDVLVIDTSDYEDWEKLQDGGDNIKGSEFRKKLMRKIKQFEETGNLEIHDKIELVISIAEDNGRHIFLVKRYFRNARKKVLNNMLENNYEEKDKKTIYDGLINLYKFLDKLGKSGVDIEKYYAKLRNNLIHHLDNIVEESLKTPSRGNVFILESFLEIAHKNSINIQKYTIQLKRILEYAEEYKLKELLEIFIEEPSTRGFEEIFSYANLLEGKGYDISKLNNEREKLMDMIIVEDIYRAIYEMLSYPCQDSVEKLNIAISKAEERGIDITEEKESIKEAFIELEIKLRELISLAYYDYMNFGGEFYFELFKLKVADAKELGYNFKDFQSIIDNEESKIKDEENN